MRRNVSHVIDGKRRGNGADITYFNRLTLSVFRLISAWVNPLGVDVERSNFPLRNPLYLSGERGKGQPAAIRLWVSAVWH